MVFDPTSLQKCSALKSAEHFLFLHTPPQTRKSLADGFSPFFVYYFAKKMLPNSQPECNQKHVKRTGSP